MSTRLAQALLLLRPTSYVSLNPRSFHSSPPSSARESRGPKRGDAASSFGLPSSSPNDQLKDTILEPRKMGSRNDDRTFTPESSRRPRSRPLSHDRRPPPSSSVPPAIAHPSQTHYRGPFHPSWTGLDGLEPDPRFRREEEQSSRESRTRRREDAPVVEDLRIPMAKRHPDYKKEVPLRRGGFELDVRPEGEEVGETVPVEEDVPQAVLALHINALPARTTAQDVYSHLIRAGLKVSTLDALDDGYRTTVIAELESDEGLRQSLKKLLLAMPMLKDKIEITGNLNTVSEIFTPSKTRLAISNIPLYTTLHDLATFLHLSGVQAIHALQLVRQKGAAAAATPDVEQPHTGLAFLWTDENQVRKVLGRLIKFQETRLVFGVARDEPIPVKSNKADWINGPALKVRPKLNDKIVYLDGEEEGRMRR